MVVGVVASVLAPIVHDGAAAENYATVFFPVQPIPGIFYYVVRSDPRLVGKTTVLATQVLAKLNPNAVVQGKTLTNIRDEHFETQKSMVLTLAAVCVVMLAVTGFGIIGLSSSWVSQRRRQIGVRRALGASRSQIMNYFRLENFIIVTAGILLGAAIAFGLNIYFSQHYELVRLDWYYVPVAAVLLWLLGQTAVFVPAYRAASTPPNAALRGT